LIVPSRVDVFLKRPVHQFKQTGHLAILPFETQEPSPKLGHEVARIFEEEISKKNFFKEITLIEDITWLNQIEYRSLKIIKAILEARHINADLVLLGAIEDFIPGTASDTKTTISVKLITVSTGETLWWGKDRIVGKPGNTFLLWGTSFSPDPPDVKKLMSHGAEKIVNNILSRVDLEKKPGFLPGLLERMKPGKRAAKAKEVVLGFLKKIKPGKRAAKAKEVVLGFFKKMKPGKRAAKLKTVEEVQTEEPSSEPSAVEGEITTKDILDRALDKLDFAEGGELSHERKK
jgi:hypothetical protein